MKNWLQRIRGAVGIGLTWAAAWAPLGALTGWITATSLRFPLGAVTVNYALMFGVLGFVGGTIFSVLLSAGERRRNFNQLSVPRFVVWGALGGLALGGLSAAAGLLGSNFSILGGVIVGVSTVLGAGSAAGTLAMARAAHGQALLEERSDIATVGSGEA